MALKHRKLKLSGSRSNWVSSRDTSIKGEPVRLNPRTAELYANEVSDMVTKMHLDVSSQIERLFKTPTAKNSIQTTDTVQSLEDVGMVSGVAMDASISEQAIALTDKLATKWNERFKSFGEIWASRMVKKSNSLSAKDLSRSMKKLSGGLFIDTNQISDKTRDKILASTDQASSLIKSIAPQYTSAVKEAVSRSILDSSSSFSRLQTAIHSMLQDNHKKTKNKAFNVAKDQMRKSYTAITASRMQSLGSGEYIWRHAGGSKDPRPYHKEVLNGQTFSLDNPPIINLKTGQRGKPGDDYYCSCYMQPVINFDNKG